jgi:hypothetical protein
MSLIKGVSVGSSSPHYELARRFQENCPVPLSDVVLFSGANPVLLDLWIDGPVHTVPAQHLHAYRFSDRFQFNQPEIELALQEAIDQGKQVYFFPYNSLPADHPALSRHEWELADSMTYGPLQMHRLLRWVPQEN